MTKLKIMKRILPIVFLALGGYQCIGQSVFATQGDVSHGETMSLSWTLGELATASLSTENGMITEGFHQPALKVESIDVETKEKTSPFTVSAYPNPVQGKLNIVNTSTENIAFSMYMYDATGKIILQKDNAEKAKTASIDMTPLAAGLYFLEVKDTNGLTIETLSITKS